MLVLPVVTRELLVQARRKNTYWIRVAASSVAGFLMLWMLLLGAAPIPTVTQGRTLFSILSTLAFVYCLLIGALVTADGLSMEKRDGTLGLLFLTDLKGYDVVLGKLVSSSLHCVYGLLAVVPMMSMALLFGGVEAGEVARMALVLGNTLFFSLAAGIFVSTLSRNERRAVFAAVLLILIVTAGPYELGFYLANNSARGTSFDVTETVLFPSPAFAFALAQPTMGMPRTGALYRSVAQTQFISWGLLGLACVWVPRVCRDRADGPRRQRWRARWQRWLHGDEAERAAFRGRLLARNPCYWLSSRERHRAAVVWVLIAALAGIGAWIGSKYPLVFYESALFLLVVLHGMLKIWFAGETCHRWVEDRRTGALELLLCAPLGDRELVHGQSLALWRQFGWPVMATLGLTFVAWIAIVAQWGHGSNTELGRTWLLMSLPALVADFTALRWVGAWLGLTARGLNRAIFGTLWRVLGLRWLIYLLCAGSANVWEWIGLGQLRWLQADWCWLAFAVTLDVLLGWSARAKFLRHFRTMAASPADFRGAISGVERDAATPTESTHSGFQARDEVAGFKRRWKPWVFAAALVGLLVGSGWGYRLWLRRQVERRIRAVQSAGFPLTTDELDRRRPALTNAVNAAEVLERAFPGLIMWNGLPSSVRFSLPGLENDLPKRTEPMPVLMKAAISSFLSSNQAGLSIVRAAPSLRTGRYEVDWRSFNGRYAIQSQGVWLVSHLLQCEAMLRAEDGDVAGALDLLRHLLDLGHSLDHEFGIMFQRMRVTCFARAFVAMEWLLARCALPDAELSALERDVSEAEARTDLPRTLVGVRCLAVDWYRTPVTSPAYPGRSPAGTFEYYVQVQLRNQLYELTGARDRDFVVYLDAMEEFVRLAQTPLPERFYGARTLAAAQRDIDRTGSPTPIFTPQVVFDSLITPDAEFVARCRAVRTALAVERFRLRHADRLPGKLEDLAPGLIVRVPSDPFVDRPLRFQRLAKGYRVYSVGKNGQDDGGTWTTAFRPGSSATRNDDIPFTVER